MRNTKSAIALAILSGFTLAACGGGGGSDVGNGGGNDGGNGGGMTDNFQTQFSQSANYNVSEENFTIDPNTLAISSSSTPSSAFDGPFSTPSGNAVTPESYFGAVDPTAAEPFWAEWTLRAPDIDGDLPGGPFHPLEAEVADGSLAPAGSSNCASIANGLADGGTTSVFGVSFPVCVITDGDLDGDFTLTNDHIYVLDGTVQVGNGDVESAFDSSTVRQDVLTVEPGTQIMAASDTAPSLVITRGSEIDASGTRDLPIIMAAVDYDASATNVITSDVTEIDGRGRWGSLVISGYGMVNNGDDNNQTTTEAVPDGITRWYGGLDNDDSSGTIRYVILAETGEAFRPDEEVQGLTIEGSGGGTTIEYLQVTNSDDDGVEWFGGAADARYLVVQGVSDDSLDMDLGFQGVVQNALVIQGANFGDRAIESDGNGDNFGATPKTSPIIVNLTILGNPGNDGSTMGALHREGFAGQVYRAAYGDDTVINNGAFGAGCLDVDSELDEDLAYGDVLFNCSAGSLVDDDDS